MSQSTEEVRFKQFDRVQLRTTRNITYLSSLPGTNPSPQGVWSVVGVVGTNELLLAKNTTIVRVPVTDVLKVADHNLNTLNTVLGRLTDGRGKRKEKTTDS